MPLSEKVEFVARLQTFNRLQVPVEVRWRFKLEVGEFLKVQVQPFGALGGSGMFVARLLGDGRITVPWECLCRFKGCKTGIMMYVWLEP